MNKITTSAVHLANCILLPIYSCTAKVLAARAQTKLSYNLFYAGKKGFFFIN